MGNDEFRVGIFDALGGGTAYLRLSLVGAASAPSFNPVARWIYPGLSLEGVGAGAGYGTWHAPLRSSLHMIGRSVDLQWFVSDPGANGQFATSETVRVTLF